MKDLLHKETECNIKMRLLYQMVKLCDKRCSFEQMLLHYFEQCTQTSFLLHNSQLNNQEVCYQFLVNILMRKKDFVIFFLIPSFTFFLLYLLSLYPLYFIL